MAYLKRRFGGVLVCSRMLAQECRAGDLGDALVKVKFTYPEPTNQT